MKQLPQSSTLKDSVTRTNRLTTNSQRYIFNRVLTNGLTGPEGIHYGIWNETSDGICPGCCGSATLSKESKLSVSYLEQIFKRLRSGKLVTSHRGPGGGYSLREGDISVSSVIRAVSKIPSNTTFDPVLVALDGVLISQLANKPSAQ